MWRESEVVVFGAWAAMSAALLRPTHQLVVEGIVELPPARQTDLRSKFVEAPRAPGPSALLSTQRNDDRMCVSQPTDRWVDWHRSWNEEHLARQITLGTPQNIRVHATEQRQQRQDIIANW